ncbi:hypothetical protein BGP78_00580 [Pseudoalteromonas sp. MSK9-3]|uniref:hypothetical protein n=1 Tax=Pseudoalteromonas sp. MSK9-3 TaxID=1897633 RepID=UPI000E6D0423|nr:hypothetical protein [Pseudoalteromonas sp. MSK9-3]RJE77534.1 hypothetical protein BGP78_00580 [Pseudoalteromonas sp. MSK9-3]
MVYNIKKSTLALGMAAVFSAFSASASLTASQTNMKIGEITVLDWTQLTPNNYPNPTFNLWVTKPNGEPRLAFRKGYTERRFARPIDMSGSHFYEVEICDSNGNNCMLPSNASIVINVDSGCDFFNGGYSCDNYQVTQSASSGQYVSEFQVIKDRATWKFTDNNTQSAAYYTACKDGSNLSQITQRENTSSGYISRIIDFVSKRSGYVTWTHLSNAGRTSNSTYIGHC